MMMSVMNTVKPNSRKETIVVALVLASILVPARFLTIYALGDHWLGALGVITAVTLVIIILAKKGKIGPFGDMFLRTIERMHKSKFRWFVYVQSSVLFVLGATAVYAIELGNGQFADQKAEVMAEINAMGIENYDDVVEKSGDMSAEEHANAIASMPEIALTKFHIIAIAAAITNDLMGGWYKFFATLILVESAEVLGLLVVTKSITKKRNETTV